MAMWVKEAFSGFKARSSDGTKEAEESIVRLARCDKWEATVIRCSTKRGTRGRQKQKLCAATYDQNMVRSMEELIG